MKHSPSDPLSFIWKMNWFIRILFFLIVLAAFLVKSNLIEKLQPRPSWINDRYIGCLTNCGTDGGELWFNLVAPNVNQNQNPNFSNKYDIQLTNVSFIPDIDTIKADRVCIDKIVLGFVAISGKNILPTPLCVNLDKPSGMAYNLYNSSEIFALNSNLRRVYRNRPSALSLYKFQ